MLNFLFIVAGGFIGFFSIVFRRILSAIIGFILGAGLGGLIAFLLDLNSGLGTGGYVIIILILGVIMAIISYRYYRFFVFLNTFLISFIVFFVISLLATNFNMNASIPIAIILAIIAGIVSVILYDPLFIISTAFLGGILLSLGCVSMFRGTDFISLIGNIIWYGSGAGLNQVTIWTIIFSIAGTIVQFMLLKKLNIGDSDIYNAKYYSSNKKCRQCGKIYTGSGICPNCSSSFYEETNQRADSDSVVPIVTPISGETWYCKKCGEKNALTSSSCKGCGAYK